MINSEGLGDQRKSDVPFFTSEESSGVSGLSAFLSSHLETERIDLTTLRDYMAESGISQVDFLKIDTEGHDYFVLRGYPFDVYLPRVIECEFEDRKTLPLGYGWKDLADYLAGLGYKIWVSEWHPIVKYGIPHDWSCLKKYPCELTDEAGWGNLLAFREPTDSDLVLSAFENLVSPRRSFVGKVLSVLRDPSRIARYLRKRMQDTARNND
jgi:hypothetical protein